MLKTCAAGVVIFLVHQHLVARKHIKVKSLSHCSDFSSKGVVFLPFHCVTSLLELSELLCFKERERTPHNSETFSVTWTPPEFPGVQAMAGCLIFPSSGCSVSCLHRGCLGLQETPKIHAHMSLA